VANQNPSRTTESHTKDGNRTVDTQSLEVLGPDGRYVHSSDVETETVLVNDTTKRTTVRTYVWDANGRRTLSQVTEEDAQSAANGDSQVVRTSSSADVNGKLQVMTREVSDTAKTAPDTQETKSTVYSADGNGGFAAILQTQESQKTGPDHAVEVKKTTLGPDGNGKWQVTQVKDTTTKEDGKNQITQEAVSQPDSEGRLSEVSRTVHQEADTPAGGKSDTVDSYSVDIPGASRDGSLHLAQRTTTIDKKDPSGETTEQQVEKPNLGNPHDGMQVKAKTKYTVLYGTAGTQQTTTTEAADGNGHFDPVFIETRKSDQAPPTAPTAPPITPGK
jgi:hypothetical protein